MSFEDNDDDDDELQLDEDDEVSPSFPTQKSAVQPLPTPFPVNGGVVRNWPDRSWGTQSQKSPTSNQLGAALAETLQPNRAAKSAPQVRLIDDLSESSNKCAYANQPGRTRSLVQKQGLPSASHSVASSARTSSSRAEPQVTVRRPAASMPRTANVGERIPVESSHTRAPFAREGASTSRKRPRRRRIPGPAGEIDGSQAAPAADEGSRSGRGTLDVRRNLGTTFGGVGAQSDGGGSPRIISSQESNKSAEDSCRNSSPFRSGAWLRMRAALGMPSEPNTTVSRVQLSEQEKQAFRYNIAYILREGFYQKVPQVSVVIESLDRTHQDALAILRDESGTMKGTIHRMALEEFRSEISVGAVLLLRKTSVFTARIGQHFLNITPRNIVRVFPPDSHRERR
eukprot:INCI14081.2.p1 GENE.INCI14081.2~~INCI14081.2.p1  ORF type:complete len:433 (-),score=40.03 INCI14081.2:36-1229(-)